MPKPGVSGLDIGGCGEKLSISIIRGVTGRKETIIKEGDIELYEEDYRALKRRGLI